MISRLGLEGGVAWPNAMDGCIGRSVGSTSFSSLENTGMPHPPTIASCEWARTQALAAAKA